MNYAKRYLYLEDGTVLNGIGFGAKAQKGGEVVFTTAMTGYPESLTDPSYAGQILVMSNPLIGNYGVPAASSENGILSNFESERIHAEALIVSEHNDSPKWNSAKSLELWLSEHGVPGMRGVDTRLLIERIRDYGVMMGIVSDTPPGQFKPSFGKYSSCDFMRSVSPSSPINHDIEGSRGRVVVVDCGVKHGILKNIADRGHSITRLPYDCTSESILKLEPTGIIYSNGPGDPNNMAATIASFKEVSKRGVPILGICLGAQIAAIALGGKVSKMKSGHRATNKAVVEADTGKAYITTHNHGYAVLDDSHLPPGARKWFSCPDDNVIEGFFSEKHNLIATQFHPEARPGANDARFVFDLFDRMMRHG